MISAQKIAMAPTTKHTRKHHIGPVLLTSWESFYSKSSQYVQTYRGQKLTIKSRAEQLGVHLFSSRMESMGDWDGGGEDE